MREALEFGRIKPDQIAAIGITNQRETQLWFGKKKQATLSIML